MRKELKIGILIFALYLIINRFFMAPDFILGLMVGLSICFEIIGFLPVTAYQRVKNVKRYLRG